MTLTVQFSGQIRAVAGDRISTEAGEGERVRDVLARLAEGQAELQRALFGAAGVKGPLLEHVLLFLDDEQAGAEQALNGARTLLVLTPISGG